MTWRHLPNALTLARIALLLPLVGLMQAGSHRAAFALVLLAAATDVLDGALARRYGWQTRLGGLLDPIADKLLMAACFVGLWSAGFVPGWLLVLVLARDAAIVGGALAYQALVAPVPAEPSRLGKATTAVQLLYVCAGFVHLLGWRWAGAEAGGGGGGDRGRVHRGERAAVHPHLGPPRMAGAPRREKVT